MEKEYTPAWKRLEKVIKASGMSTNAFALHIGLKRSENLYQIKKGNHAISKSLATIINNYYPQYSLGWLLSGEGECGEPADPEEIKLKNETIRSLYVYDSVFSVRDESPPDSSVKKLYLPDIIVRNSEFAIINFDEAMNPKIPIGSYVLVRKHTGPVVYGNVYVIVTAHFSLMRIVRMGNYEGQLKLTPSHPQSYDDIIIDVNEIRKIYSVDFILAEIN
ncbi:MAG: S24/S26 family peptidase [Rikenellaceae bacterium]|nr:S24/S26 family peptidase [Rikenellaceae bacterium]